ncbi:MAG: hypothetical protein C5S41_12970, partial [Candidatus Methanomarinus sp.]
RVPPFTTNSSKIPKPTRISWLPYESTLICELNNHEQDDLFQVILDIL